VRVLLDTHILLWAADIPERLGPALPLIANADARLLSAASTWELAIKQSLGKIRLSSDVGVWFTQALVQLSAQPLAITPSHAAAVAQLPAVHRDPFDRLLVAQAQQENALLLTADRTLAAYGDVVRVVE